MILFETFSSLMNKVFIVKQAVKNKSGIIHQNHQITFNVKLLDTVQHLTEMFILLTSLSLKAGTHKGTCCRDVNRAGTSRDKSPGEALPFVCEEILLRGQTSVAATCCMKFNCFDFLGHEAGTKMAQSFNVASRALLCKLSPLQSWRYLLSHDLSVPVTCPKQFTVGGK